MVLHSFAVPWIGAQFSRGTSHAVALRRLAWSHWYQWVEIWNVSLDFLLAPRALGSGQTHDWVTLLAAKQLLPAGEAGLGALV